MVALARREVAVGSVNVRFFDEHIVAKLNRHAKMGRGLARFKRKKHDAAGLTPFLDQARDPHETILAPAPSQLELRAGQRFGPFPERFPRPLSRSSAIVGPRRAPQPRRPPYKKHNSGWACKAKPRVAAARLGGHAHQANRRGIF